MTKHDEELAALKLICDGTNKYGIGALLEAFRLCANRRAPLPAWLARAVHAALVDGANQQRLKHYKRWREVRRMRDRRPRLLGTGNLPRNTKISLEVAMREAREIGRNQTFDLVSEKLEKTGAAGSPRTVEESYELVEKSLPPEQRYERTYKRRPHCARSGD